MSQPDDPRHDLSNPIPAVNSSQAEELRELEHELHRTRAQLCSERAKKRWLLGAFLSLLMLMFVVGLMGGYAIYLCYEDVRAARQAEEAARQAKAVAEWGEGLFLVDSDPSPPKDKDETGKSPKDKDHLTIRPEKELQDFIEKNVAATFTEKSEACRKSADKTLRALIEPMVIAVLDRSGRLHKEFEKLLSEKPAQLKKHSAVWRLKLQAAHSNLDEAAEFLEAFDPENASFRQLRETQKLLRADEEKLNELAGIQIARPSGS